MPSPREVFTKKTAREESEKEVKMMKVLSKAKIETVLNKMAKAADVYVPMQRGPLTGFFAWKTFNEDNDDLLLDALNVFQPPKHVVLQQTEKDNNCKQAGTEVSFDKVYQEAEPKIIFGARGCDIKGIDYLDELFLTKDYKESFYKDQRDKTTIVANACYHPGASCFCTSMGGNPTDADSADVIIRDAGKEGYVWESKSDKGQALTAQIADLLEEKEVVLPEALPFTRTVDYEGVAEKLKDMFEHPLWEKHSEPCQTCGICTYSCPTCSCFDIQVKNWGGEGYRFNCYDSCIYRGKSLVAGVNNPREAAQERFRNRFLHKLQFYPEKYGKPLCTGCGRCIVVCPAGVSIAKIITEVKEADLRV